MLSVGKQPHEVLRRSDFIKLMSQNDILGREGGDQRSQDLLIMQYRRQRMIDDIKDPDRRKGFASEEAFNRRYRSGMQRRKSVEGAPAAARRPSVDAAALARSRSQDTLAAKRRWVAGGSELLSSNRRQQGAASSALEVTRDAISGSFRVIDGATKRRGSVSLGDLVGDALSKQGMRIGGDKTPSLPAVETAPAARLGPLALGAPRVKLPAI